jgi:hypothetical protein
MKYELIIRELTPFTEEELKNSRDREPFYERNVKYSDIPNHEIRVLHAEVSKEEFEIIKKAIIGII